MDANNNSQVSPESSDRNEKILPSPDFEGTLSKIVRKGKEIYAIKFYQFIRDRYIFAAVIENLVFVYETAKASDVRSKQFKLLQTYQVKTPSNRTSESLYALDWSYDAQHNNAPVLAVGGSNQSIAVIQMAEKCQIDHLSSHTGDIYDLKFHPKRPAILASASADQSVRLWNVATRRCIALFHGHLNLSEVLSVEFDAEGKRFASSDMGHQILIWNLEDDELVEKIEKSYSTNDETKAKAEAPFRVFYPIFITSAVHKSAVDSLIWFGDSIISKSALFDVASWRPTSTKSFKSTIHCFDHGLTEEDGIWFIRMGMDNSKSYLAVGEQCLGGISIWNFNKNSIFDIRKSYLKHRKAEGTIRMITFSADSEIILAGSSSGQIVQFEKIKPKQAKKQRKSNETVTSSESS